LLTIALYDARMDGIDWASSAMIAARTRLDIATGNLANVSSGGFREVLAQGRLTARGAEIERVISREHGSLEHTGRATDKAIVGDGYFRLRDVSGVVSETRNGSFTRDRNGALRDDAGRELIGERLGAGASVRTGFLETANVNAIAQMIEVLSAERSFESAQKVVTAIDATNQKASNDVARIK
jgi:flagellar basal body rod protein FlgG